MKLLVTHPEGPVGRRVVRELLAPEFEVRVLTDDPAGLPAEILANTELLVGAADDTGRLRDALEGVEALFWNVAPPDRSEPDVAGHCERLARACAGAVRASKTPRVVNISTLCADVPDAGGFVGGLRSVERHLNETGAAVRHVRCGWLMENFLRQAESIVEHGVFSTPTPGNVPLPLTAARDVADAALRALVRRDWTGVGAVEVRGRTAVSMDRAAEVFADLLERSVRHREISANAFAGRLLDSGFGFEHARSIIGSFAALARAAEPSPAIDQHLAPTTFAAWVEAEPCLSAAARPVARTG